MSRYFFESMSVGAAYVCIVLLVLASCEAGFLIGRHHQRKSRDEEAHASVGPMVGALLSMLAFVLAFTFSMAASHHDARKRNVLAEANHIGTAYLRADFLVEPQRAEVKRLLIEYVDIRLQAANPDGDWQEALKRSLEIQHLLRSRVTVAARADPAPTMALLVESINQIIDMHEQRLMDAVRARIPGGIWFGLMAIAVLAMGAMGVQLGLSGKRRLIGIVPVALAYSILATLILDLNRPQGGFIKVGQQPMMDLRETLSREARQIATGR